MKVVLHCCLNNPRVYPAMNDLAVGLAEAGAQVSVLSTVLPQAGQLHTKVDYVQIPPPATKGFWARIPVLRGGYGFIFRQLRAERPDYVIAQHEYAIPALLYRATGAGKTRVAGYFSDYHKGRWYTRLLKPWSRAFDAYVDICDLRVAWRRADWPRMTAPSFVIRQAPARRHAAQSEAHDGPARLVLTSSRYILGLDRERLSRFLTQLCLRGISVDWYLPGSDAVRESAAALSDHPAFRVLGPFDKTDMMTVLGQYDLGLHWAPLAERARDRSYFESSASNKVGEYIAAGLVVAQCGNPGLNYLPEGICVRFDPRDPVRGADQLADAMSDRARVEQMRQAALRYHLDEMHFNAQAMPFVTHVVGLGLSAGDELQSGGSHEGRA